MIWDAITFPNLNPAALTLPGFDLFGLHLGPFPLRWYALAYIVGLVLGWRWMVFLINKTRLWTPNKAPLTVTQADDFLFWATLGVILGGRLGYVLFYNTSIIWEKPAEIIQIWNGGMSFHGGLIGVAIASIWFTRQNHVDEAQFAKLAKQKAVKEPPVGEEKNWLDLRDIGWVKRNDVKTLRQKSMTARVALLPLGDLAAAATPIGLFFGRIANFINGELWGRPTNLPWGMIFCNQRIRDANSGTCPANIDDHQVEVARHPSQLYEAALEGLALFAIINVLTLRYDSLRRPGMNAGVFLVCYGIIRAVLETVREPDEQMPSFLKGYITMGMVLCIPMMILGAWLIRRALKSPPLPAPKPA